MRSNRTLQNPLKSYVNQRRKKDELFFGCKVEEIFHKVEQQEKENRIAIKKVQIWIISLKRRENEGGRKLLSNSRKPPRTKESEFQIKRPIESPGWKQTHHDTSLWNLRITDRQKIPKISRKKQNSETNEKIGKIQTLTGN